MRTNPLREDSIRWVEAVEIFHSLYIPSGPYRSVVPRLVGEIVERLAPPDPEEMKRRLLSEFGKRGAATKNRNRLFSSPSQLDLFPNL